MRGEGILPKKSRSCGTTFRAESIYPKKVGPVLPHLRWSIFTLFGRCLGRRNAVLGCHIILGLLSILVPFGQLWNTRSVCQARNLFQVTRSCASTVVARDVTSKGRRQRATGAKAMGLQEIGSAPWDSDSCLWCMGCGPKDTCSVAGYS